MEHSVRTYPASPPRRRLTSTEHVRRGEMVPSTTLADLNHIHPEFAVFGSHLHQFSGFLNPSRILSEFVTIHIGNMCDISLTADRAALFGGLAVVLGRAEQVRVRVAGIRHRGVTGAYGRKGGPPGKRVIHNRASSGYACHVPSITRGRPSVPPGCRLGRVPPVPTAVGREHARTDRHVNSRLPAR